MFSDVWAVVVVVVALVVVGALMVLQVRGRAVWSWAWFVPGGLVLVYWLVALWLRLTEFGLVMGVGYIDDASTVAWLRNESPWVAGVSGLLFALSAGIVSLRGRVESWHAARVALMGALVGVLVVGGLLLGRLILWNEMSLQESMEEIYESRIVLWAVVFLLALGACIRGAAGRLSRERAVLVGGLAVGAGAMIVTSCVVPAAYRAMFLLYAPSRVPSSETMVLGRALQNNLSEAVWPEVLLAFLCTAVCAGLMLRKSTVGAVQPKRRALVGLGASCLLVGGLVGAVVLKTGEVKEQYVREIQMDLLGPLPHSSSDHIVPWSARAYAQDDSALGIIVGRTSLEVTTYYGADTRYKKQGASIAFARGQAIPEEFGRRILETVERRKEEVATRYLEDDGLKVVVAADQLTDYGTLYALIEYVTDGTIELSQLRLLVRRYNESRRAVTDGTIFIQKYFGVPGELADDAEAYARRVKDDEEALRVHIRPQGFAVRFRGEVLAPVDGCPSDGPTVCTRVPADRLQAMLEEARQHFLQQQNEPAQKLADAYMNSFDYRNLYNQLARLKKESEGSRVIISADGEIPYNVVVKVMDTLQVFLEHDHYETDEAFESAELRNKNDSQDSLFDIQQLAPPR